jgi:hypothetical protein
MLIEMVMHRQLKFKTNEELVEAVDDYFKNGVRKKSVIVGRGENKEVVEIEVPTITGLAIHLGFESRQSFYDYEKREGFSYTIKRARTFIEQHYEELLQVGNTTGAIFALKNMGWIDRHEADITTKGESVNRIEVSKEQIDKLIDKL